MNVKYGSCCTQVCGGFIAVSTWAVFSDDDAICLIMSSLWRAIISLRGCSSIAIIPVLSNKVKYGDSLAFVAVLY